MFSSNISKGDDGVYRWTYEMNMWRNPTVLITLWKVFFIAAMFPVVFVTLLSLFEDGVGAAVKTFAPMFFMMTAIMSGLVFIGYFIYTIINGGRYQVVFEMDEKGIRHIQLKSQFKKNQVIAWIGAFAGAASGNATVSGAGLLAASKSSSYCQFTKVRKIRVNRRRNVIYVNESLERNQVYVSDEDFEAVRDYLISRCPKAKVC